MYEYKEKSEKMRGRREHYKWKNNYDGQNIMENNPNNNETKAEMVKAKNPRKSRIKESPG